MPRLNQRNACDRAVPILHRGLDASSETRNFDFGPGFYVNIYFNDAKQWYQRRIASYSREQAAILISGF
ncbi:unnamed protein product, partial [Didymodactylos carnosus]